MSKAQVGLAPEDTPRRVRLLALGAVPQPRIGDRIEGDVLLLPLPLPVEPGAFDYGRSLFFQSIGATGRFTSPFAITEQTVPASYQLLAQLSCDPRRDQRQGDGGDRRPARLIRRCPDHG